MSKTRTWLRNRKKTEPEVPYQPPFWLGDHSNGEQYYESTAQDRAMHELILRKGEEQARRHGLERREFMASGLGVALSMYCMNLINGCGGGKNGGLQLETGPLREEMDPAECEAALDASKHFIFDIQTHRVESDKGVYRQFIAGLPQAFCGKQGGPAGPLACFTKDEYVREMFLDSDTTMTVLSGVPAVDGLNPLTNEQIAETRDFVNGIASDSERVITHAMVLPNYNHEAQIDGMARIAAERAPIGAWKCYTPWGPGDGVTGFWLDDPKTGLPFIQRGREVGVKTFCCHKGLPLPGFDNNYGDPKDIGKVAKLFPDCNFIVYHSAYQFGAPPSTATEIETLPYTPGDKKGVNSLITAMLDNQHPNKGSNIYGELGTTWISVMRSPVRATHILGKLLKYLGEDNIVWGTDSMWYGSPQPQILAFLAFQMDPKIREAQGYPDLTMDIKLKILGLNAAKLFNVDPKQKRCQIEAGAISASKQQLDAEFGRYRWAFDRPRLTNRRDFFRNAAFHRAAKTPG